MKFLNYFPDYGILKIKSPDIFISLRNLEKRACSECGYLHEIPREKGIEWTCSVCGTKHGLSLRTKGESNKHIRCPICEAEFTDNNHESLMEKWGDHIRVHNS